ncbi:MAG: multidrug efflux MFS transporter [Pseudomonadales bacterium]|nr:multidrug efflux MFS transporter [Pseudomonadales bacterium]
MSVSTQAASLDEDKASLETPHRGLLMMAVMSVSVIQFLDVTIANVALPHMQSSLGASLDTISWVLTSYIIAGVMMTPVAGWLSDRIGSRRLFLVAVAGFLLASMLCGAATSLMQMVFFRAIQGTCTAFIAPMSQTIMFDINPPSKQPAAMTLWGLVVMIAPIAGPMIGGVLTESLNWRWIFYVNLPIGIPTLMILAWLLPSRPKVRRKLDMSGFLLLALGLGCLQLMMDRGQSKDWFDSWEIIIELLVALSVFWVFLIHTLDTKVTLFPGALMRNPNFLGALAFMFILGVANVAIAAVLPIMYQNVYNFSVLDTGLLMAPRGVGVIVTMMITNRLMGRVDVRHLITCGYLVASLALWTMSNWSLDMDRGPIVVSSFVQGLGLGFVFMPMNMIAFATLEPQYRPDGSSLLNLMRNIGGSFGISIIVTMLSRNTQTGHADMAANITSYNLSGIDPATTADRFGEYGTVFLQLIDAEINRQALMIAYIDNFHAMALFILCVAPVALLLKPLQLPFGVKPLPSEREMLSSH